MKPKIMEIIDQVAKLTGYTREDIIGPSRNKHLVGVRHFAMWRAYEETGRSFPEIGLVFKRDHTSVLHGVRKVRAMNPAEIGIFEPKPVRLTRKCRKPAETYVGDRCKHGHYGLRYIHDDRCVACVKEQRAAKAFVERVQRWKGGNPYKIAAE